MRAAPPCCDSTAGLSKAGAIIDRSRICTSAILATNSLPGCHTSLVYPNAPPLCSSFIHDVTRSESGRHLLSSAANE